MPSMSTGINIYAMGDYGCPNKDIVRTYYTNGL
jgi:hypothetical protein